LGLHNQTGGNTDDVIIDADYTWRFGNSNPNGQWLLWVRDRVSSDTGYIDYLKLTVDT
jgi:subtilisin-like proprotein convertase family protein